MDIEQAIIIAATAHNKQKDKSGQPYILHPLRVMLAMESEDGRVAAVLHDVIEDTNVSAGKLLDMGVPKNVVDAVVLLTHIKSDDFTYMDYIRKIRDSGDALAYAVKLSDITDNMRPERLHKLDDENKNFLIHRYEKARKCLVEDRVGRTVSRG